ncbi:MAG: hypothetical protein HFJ66_01400 [Eggerthellaceae bacterium]|nr:hypothetical protein [Eggerthellaceae bacterium]
MTLNDLFLLLRHHLRWVIAVPLACMVAAGGLAAVKSLTQESSYSATASLAVADITNSLSSANLMLLLNSTAQNAATEASAGSVEVEAVPEDKTQSVAFEALAGSEGEAIEAANAAAEKTADLLKETLLSQADVFKQEADKPADEASLSERNAANTKAAALEACVFTVTPADEAKSGGNSAGALKFAAVGFVGGLFVVVLVLLLVDAARRPIKSREDIAQITDLSVVNGHGGVNGAKLARAAVLTFCDGLPETVCLVSDCDFEDEFVDQFEMAFKESSEGIETTVVSVGSLSDSPGGFFVAQQSDATLVCAKRWESSASSLLFTLEELKLAKAKVAGIALV